MAHPTSRPRPSIKIVLTTLTFAVALIALSLYAGHRTINAFREADAAAQYSAQAALLLGIEQYLTTVPPGGTYPKTLDEIALTYPDGGDASLLSLFTYQSDGSRCTLQTHLRDRIISEEYPRGSSP